ncbi:MAG: hypothetical protein PWQ77_1624 [Kosmotogales bacterium]|nr:hypothetical protein [Kosmotogales bacterium]
MFNIYYPCSEDELKILLNENNATIISGGTDLMVKIKHHVYEEGTLISTSKIKTLSFIEDDDDFVYIGSATTLSEIQNSKKVQKFLPMLLEAIRYIGSKQIRNRATLAGNLVNASPAADTIVPLILLDAEITVRSLYLKSIHKLEDFITGPGKTILKNNEYVYSIKIKKQDKNQFSKFIKVGKRNAMAISVASMGIIYENERLKIAFGSVAPTVIRIRDIENIVPNSMNKEKIIQKCLSNISPIDDVRSTKKYRITVIKNLLNKYIEIIERGEFEDALQH